MLDVGGCCLCACWVLGGLVACGDRCSSEVWSGGTQHPTPAAATAAAPAWLAQDSWSATVQLVLLIFTSLVVLGLVPLLLLTTNRLSSAMFSPVKTPTASVQQVRTGHQLAGAAGG